MITDKELADGEIEWEIITDPVRCAEIRERLARFEADCLELSEMEAELLRELPETYAAMFEGRLFHSPDFDSLLADLRRSGVDPARAVVRYLTRKPLLHFHYGPV
jgi:hypothetical protein